ncbi:hypothetical protein [Aphanothece sacrum]|uniref:hypothetical protein n=1 Tax=Aphanothece sacrum TaxID=1122 RepID=UPI0011CEDCFF|nr:hypothetical protein [Aphanothece sacrum]
MLFSGLFLLLSILFLFGFGSAKLSCSRVNVNHLNCLHTKSVALGFVKEQEASLFSLKKAKVDEIIIPYLDADTDGTVIRRELSKYGVLLIDNENIVFNNYINNREQQQQVVNKINDFLNNPSDSSLLVEDRNYLLDFMILSFLTISIILLFKGILTSF